MVDVKQVDRDTASDACEMLYSPAKLTQMRQGRCDNHRVIQALAAQRESFEARIAELERERDEARSMFDKHVVWASEQGSAAESRLASYDALVEALRRWNDWHRKATADDDCEYLNGDGWADASETWHFADAALKKVGR